MTRPCVFSHGTPMLGLDLADSFAVKFSDGILTEVEDRRVQILRFGNQNSERGLYRFYTMKMMVKSFELFNGITELFLLKKVLILL